MRQNEVVAIDFQVNILGVYSVRINTMFGGYTFIKLM